jgi:hypothetical protein
MAMDTAIVDVYAHGQALQPEQRRINRRSELKTDSRLEQGH